MKGRSFLALLAGLAVIAAGLLIVDVQLTPTHALAGPSAMAADDGDDEGETPAIKGSDKKGKYYFKKTCKGCHTEDAEGGLVTPISKTIKQWERYFKKDKHYGDETLSGTFDAEQLIHIQTFLINHAADSDQPETCG